MSEREPREAVFPLMGKSVRCQGLAGPSAERAMRVVRDRKFSLPINFSYKGSHPPVKQAELAAYLDVSVRTLRDLIARGIVPKGADLDAARKGYLRHLREVAANRVPTGALDPATERGLLDKARREEIELRIKEKIGELIPADAVADHWVRNVTIARNKFLGLPSRLAPSLRRCKDTREVEVTLKAAIHAVSDRAGQCERNA